jgi:hypothetical protein
MRIGCKTTILQTIEIKKATGNGKKLIELIKWQFDIEKYFYFGNS